MHTHCLSNPMPAPETLSDAPALRRVSTHRPPALRLPEDPQDAAAQALAFVRGDDSYVRASAIEAMSERVATLGNPDNPEALSELTAHLPLLNALFIRFTVEATAASKPEHRSTLLRMALSAQRSYAQTAALVAGLTLQRTRRGAVIVHADSDDL
jgi:hypothetical protein